jgi:integrase
MKRRRYQKGSLQLRRQGGRKVWTVLYYKPGGRRGYRTIGPVSEMTKGQAETARQEFMREQVNGGDRKPRKDTTRPPTVKEFLDIVYLPFYRGKWKQSSRSTTERRISQHIDRDLGRFQFETLTVVQLQEFLNSKATDGLSKNSIDQIRFDLVSIFRMALAEGVATTNPALELYTPRESKQPHKGIMDREQVIEAISALPQREALIVHLAVLAGMRPGEILAVQCRHVSVDCREIQIDQRVYDGVIDDPKTYGSRRRAAIAPETAMLLAAWIRDSVEGSPEVYLFASESGTPLQPGNVMRRIIRPALEKIGLGWFNFQVARRTHASLGHDIDPKVMADQRGHGIGVALDTYTKSSQEEKAAAAGKLAKKILHMPAVKKTA